MINSPPDILYKYRIWDNSFNSRLLLSSEIYFSSPSMFNDPFDCSPPVRYDVLIKNEVINKSRKLLKHDEPSFNREQIRKESKSRLKYGYRKNPEKQINYQIEYRENNFGVYSLTSNPNNIVMWSHYANSHRGFCVGFNTEKLLEYMKSISKNNGPLIDLLKVKYQEEYPILDPRELNDEEFVIEPLIIKSINYSYEDEYRLISINGNKYPVSLPNEVFSEIILGCNISKEDRDAIKSVVKEKFHDTKLLYAKMCKDRFALEFQKIKFGKIKTIKA